jgi:hypothetical protein
MVDGNSEANGTFEFVDVSLDPNLLYAVMITYNNAVYASEPVNVAEGQTELSLEIPIYESTTDTSAVQIDRQHILFDSGPEGLRVAEIYILSNTGDRTITGQGTEEDAPLSSLQFFLPEGATNITFNENSNGGRFVLAPGGFIDTVPLRPGVGSSQVVATYVLPYEDSLTYSWTAQWPVENLSFMLVSGIGLSLEGENLTPEGTESIGQGNQVEVFSHGALEPGQSVEVSLSGTLLPPLGAPAGDILAEAEVAADTRPSSKKALALGGAVLGLTLLAVGVWWYRRPELEEMEEGPDEPAASYEHLLNQIALLDEAHDRGEINGSEYIKKRAHMFRQAKVILDQASEQDTVSPSPSY